MTGVEGQFASNQGDLISIDTPRVYLAASRRSVDLSRVTLGIVSEFKRREIGVAVAKVGSSLVEPTHYRRISGRLCHTLDPWMLTPNQLIESFARLSSGTEILFIEGECGLYDQRDKDFHLKRDSDIAALLRAPIVFVVDAADTYESIGALVQGFAQYDHSTNLLGVIATNVKNEEQDSRIAGAVNKVTGITYLGGMPLDSADYASGPSDNPSSLTRSYVVGLRDMVSKSIDIEELSKIARSAGSLNVSSSVVGSQPRCCRVAVADDAGFHLTVQDNLDLIRRAGAELSAFSPMADIKLPADVWGVYLPSGYTHLYGEEAMRNKRMVAAIQEFVAKGGVIYAEGAALPYLCREFTVKNGAMIRGVGIVPATSHRFSGDVLDSTPKYYEVVLDRSSLGPDEATFKAVSTNQFVVRPEEQMQCWSVAQSRVDPNKEDGEEEGTILQGFVPQPNLILNQVQGHWSSRPEISSAFVSLVEAAQKKHSGK